MERRAIKPREGWQAEMENVGFSFHSLDGAYWDESACYRFSATEIDMIEEATAKLHEMSLLAVQAIIDRRLFDRLSIQPWLADHIVKSWLAQAPSLYGRFDLRYDGINSPKLLEYNADTPTSLIEAAVAQWNWLQAVKPRADQFNSLHEKLIARWGAIRTSLPGVSPRSIFTCLKDSEEDLGNLEYLRDTALQAGHRRAPDLHPGHRLVRRSRPLPSISTICRSARSSSSIRGNG
jgi:glutathionylspermidine synthase